MRAVGADRLLFPERVFADPPVPFFLFRLEFAERVRFPDDLLFEDALFRVPVRPEPLRDAAVVLRPVPFEAPPPVREPLAFGLIVVGRITSGGSSL